MSGLRRASGRVYVCGSVLYRKRKGCGPGVSVPQEWIERETIEGLREIVGYCSDPKGFTKKVNEEVARLWESSRAPDPEVNRRLEEIDAKIANVRKAIEEGLTDTAWANTRLQELSSERRKLSARTTGTEPPPVVSVEEAMAYRRQVEKLFAVGSTAERKRLLAACVEKVILAPDRREVEITYRVPEPVMNRVVAGAGFEPATFGL
jgi:hypothetical protein